MAKISMTVSDINTIITKLTTSSDTIEKTWNSIKTDEVEKIKTSWIGDDCDAYVKKIIEMDDEVSKALQAQRLLAETYKTAKNQIESAQDSLKSQVESI